MAAQEIQGTDIRFLVRDFGTAEPYQEMVCEETLLFDLTNAVTSRETKTCGTFKGIKVAEFKANGSAVNNLTPTYIEYSYNQLQLDQNATQKKDFRIENRAFTGYAAGEAIKMTGAGYFVGSQLNASVGEVASFTWNFEGVGLLNTDES